MSLTALNQNHDHLPYKVILTRTIEMRIMAVAVEITEPHPQVEVVCNPLPANVVKTKIIDKKYKRVDRDNRLKFLDFVAQGRSISQVHSL